MLTSGAGDAGNNHGAGKNHCAGSTDGAASTDGTGITDNASSADDAGSVGVVPANAAEAIAMAQAALGYLARADITELPVAAQAELLAGLERAEAMTTAARAAALAAFVDAQGPHADAAYSARSWMYHKTRVTKGAAAAYISWSRRLTQHLEVVTAMAEGHLSESWARTICQWTDKLPADYRQPADQILVAAAVAGADLAGLAEIYAEILSRARQAQPDDDRRKFEDRSVRLETTFDGAGVLSGDLTPECAAVVGAVLDALAAPDGAADERTQQQRYHDGLAEAMRRLLASDLLPQRAGQPTKALVHISLADLRGMDTGAEVEDEWTRRVQAEWAAALGRCRRRRRRRWRVADRRRRPRGGLRSLPDPGRHRPGRTRHPGRSGRPRRRAGRPWGTIRSARGRSAGHAAAGHHRQGRRPDVRPGRDSRRSCAENSSA